jgi:prepilin-type N-terminal cleavage/methylation domain-containing protein
MEILTKKIGFTAIELIVVVVVIAIFAVYVTLKGLLVPGTNLKAQANLLASDIRYAQNLSMTAGQHFSLVIINNKSYKINNGSGTAIAMPAGSDSVTLGNGITFDTITNLPNNLITFDSQGTPYTDAAATQLLSANALLTLIAGNKTVVITITPSTGSVMP